MATSEAATRWDEDVAGGAAIEDICKATRAIDDASADLADAVVHAKGVPELEQAGVVERIEGDVQPRLNATWAALKGAIELATNAMATREEAER